MQLHSHNERVSRLLFVYVQEMFNMHYMINCYTPWCDDSIFTTLQEHVKMNIEINFTKFYLVILLILETNIFALLAQA